MTRFIGIRHRSKKTREGEARPTMVAIKRGDLTVAHELEDDTAELDFLMGRFPIGWRKVTDTEELFFHSDEHPEGFFLHQCKTRAPRKDENISQLHASHLVEIFDSRILGLVPRVITQVPTTFEGLKAGDIVGMLLGGTGDRLASALSRRGEEVSAQVYRIPAFTLKESRGEASKDDDHVTLAALVEMARDKFYFLRQRDRNSIRVQETLALRQDALRARIGCEQRMLQALMGRIFLNEEGRFPEGVVKDQVDREKANDAIYKGLVQEEERREKELKRAVRATEVWSALLEPIEGVGERLAAGLMAPIGDIRRFWVNPERMEECYQKSREFEKLGRFEEDLPNIAGALSPTATIWEKLRAVAAYKREHGKTDEAALLIQASDLHKERGRLLNQGKHKVKKFCGVHVLGFHRGGLIVDNEGSPLPTNRQFPRQRGGQLSNWNPAARQALYLLGDQFNRRPQSFWGQKLLEYKLKLRQTHPEVIEEPVKEKRGSKEVTLKKKRYTNGHIHKMAIWRTLTKFVERFYLDWTRLEQEAERVRRDSLDLESHRPSESELGQHEDGAQAAA